MTPATRALAIRSFCNGGARFFCLVDHQIAQDEKFFQLLLVDLGRNIGIRMQDNRSLESVSDQFLLARVLNRLSDHAAQFQKVGNLSARPILAILGFGQFEQVDRTARP